MNDCNNLQCVFLFLVDTQNQQKPPIKQNYSRNVSLIQFDWSNSYIRLFLLLQCYKGMSLFLIIMQFKGHNIYIALILGWCRRLQCNASQILGLFFIKLIDGINYETLSWWVAKINTHVISLQKLVIWPHHFEKPSILLILQRREMHGMRVKHIVAPKTDFSFKRKFLWLRFFDCSV